MGLLAGLFVLLASGILDPVLHQTGQQLGLMPTPTAPAASITAASQNTTSPPAVTIPPDPTEEAMTFPTRTPGGEFPTSLPEPSITPSASPAPPTDTPFVVPSPVVPTLAPPVPAAPTVTPDAAPPAPVPVQPSPVRPTFVPTAVIISTATTAPTATPSPTFPPPAPAPPPSFNACQADTDPYAAPNYPIRILYVNKETEVFLLQNVSDAPVNLDGWIMCSVNGSQRLERLPVTLQPGELRELVFPGAAVWNNEERDDGALYNVQGQLISYWFDF